MDELRTALTYQKYPQNATDRGIEKAMNINREYLLVVRDKSKENIIPFLAIFNPKNPEMFNTIRQNLLILYEDETMNEIVQEYQIIKSKRQPWNLKRLLHEQNLMKHKNHRKKQNATDLTAEFVHI